MKQVLIAALMALATPALAIDRCLVGVWQADGDDIASVMGAQMGGSAVHVGGRVSIEIDPTGTMTLLAEDFAVAVAVPSVPEVVVTVTGYSQGAMNADDGRTYVANAPEYSLVGSAMVLGQRMDIPVTSASGSVWGQSRGTYGCSGASVSFDATELGSIPRRWTRIN